MVKNKIPLKQNQMKREKMIRRTGFHKGVKKKKNKASKMFSKKVKKKYKT